MTVRVVARVRPLLKTELEKDQIVKIEQGADGNASIVKIPNPKNFSEEYSFQFNSVYGQDSTQQQIFDAEVAPTVKHLFQGYDVTIFAFGSTGSGKTFTTKGGKSLADRGVIPRLLSSIYRKSKAIEKSSEGTTVVTTSMSYYEIYNDRVFDLLEAPEKRTATGLPIREAEGGKTVVVGLTEIPCGSLKEFEGLYDMANANRSTGATKLNAHSSRSHAILCVKVTITTPTEVRVSTACAIDLAGSEDNRRTGNGKDRMVESASINKSLFVLAQCVEAISKKQQRIPYRESKMTRILSLGQNNGFTIMILNLAPVKAFHLDTISSLNFANRTKKIEVREIENEPMFKGPPRAPSTTSAGQTVQRQPLRPLTSNININLTAARDGKIDKPAKQFSVYADKSKMSMPAPKVAVHKTSPSKRHADSSFVSSTKPVKQIKSTPLFLRRGPEVMSKETIESLVEKKVSEILATKALNAPEPKPTKDISSEVQARLDLIEKRLEGQEGERAEGLNYLFMAKQHQARGEDSSALKMYELARSFFPDNEKLEKKIDRLREKINMKKASSVEEHEDIRSRQQGRHKREYQEADEDESYHAEAEDGTYDNEEYSDEDRVARKKSKTAKTRKPKAQGHASGSDTLATTIPRANLYDEPGEASPRTRTLLTILNSRDGSKMKALNGLGAKRAEAIVAHLNDQETGELICWSDILDLDVRGIGQKTWMATRAGLVV